MTVEQLLRRQHAELRELLRFVRNANGRARIAFEALADAEHMHWVIEERHLYPLLERLDYPDMSQSSESHHALRRVVAELAGLSDTGPHFLSALGVLSAQLEQHIVDEERSVLPFLGRALSHTEDASLVRAMLGTIAEIENENWAGAPEAWINHYPEM